MSTPTDLTDDVLAERIRAACAEVAGRVEVTPRPFEPGAARLRTDRSARASGPRGWLVAAAIVAVVALGVAVVAVAGDRDDGRTVIVGSTSTSTTTAPAKPEPADLYGTTGLRPLVPRTVPDGFVLEDVALQTTKQIEQLRTQLFGTSATGGAKVLISIDTKEQGFTPVGPRVTIRGSVGTSDAYATAGRNHRRLLWQERGATLEATAVGIGPTELIAAVDQLVWRSADPADGFEPAPGGALVALAEAGPWTGPVISLQLAYREDLDPADSGSGRRLTILSMMGDSGELSGTYLTTWLDGTVATDGGRRSVRSYDSGLLGLRLGAPGDPDVMIQGAQPGDFTEGELDAFAEVLRPIRRGELATLQAQVNERLAGRKLLDAVEVGDRATVELRGSASAPATCLVVDGTRACEASDPGFDAAPSVVVDGHWFVAAAVTDRPRAEKVLRAGRGAVPYDTARFGPVGGRLDRGWAIVIPVPDDLDEVTIWQDDYGFDPQRPRG